MVLLLCSYWSENAFSHWSQTLGKTRVFRAIKGEFVSALSARSEAGFTVDRALCAMISPSLTTGSNFWRRRPASILQIGKLSALSRSFLSITKSPRWKDTKIRALIQWTEHNKG